MKALFNFKFSAITIVALILINFTTIFLLVQRSGIFSREPGNSGFLKNELQLTSSQLDKMKQIKKEHFKQAGQMMDDIVNLKEQMFSELFVDNTDTLKVQRLTESIGRKQSQLEYLTFKHFIKIKEICKFEQQEKLQRLLDEFFRSTRQRFKNKK